MLIKIIGAFIVISSSALLGISYKYRHRSHIKELENLMLCLKLIKQEISISLNDITKAFEKTLSCASSHNEIMLNNFLKNAKSSDGEALSEIWTRSLNEIKSELIYDSIDVELIGGLGNLLGTGDSETQLENIIDIENKLQKRIELCNSKGEKTDVSSKLGVYAGIIIAVLLI